MASKEYIAKRLESATKKVTSLEKKMGRILKAKEHNWDSKFNPYLYNEWDVKSTTRELELAKENVEKYTADLKVAEEKEASRNVEAILTFLEYWRMRVRNYATKLAGEYTVAYNKMQEELKKYNLNYREEWEMEKNNPEGLRKIERARREIAGKFSMRYSFVEPYMDRALNPETNRYDIFVMDIDALNDNLMKESNRKYDFIIERTNRIVGVITDASGLSIGDKGDLNGYIIGTKGIAKVQTIGAGGYNIQCFHFRTLINEVK